MRWHHQLLIPLLVIIAGCASQPGPTPDPDWSRHSVELRQLENWELSGKLALRTSEGAESANLTWQQQQRRSMLKLSGPLGSQATNIDSDGETVEIRRGDQRETWDLSQPVSGPMGLDLPLRALPYWIKGIPAPGLPVDSMKVALEREVLEHLSQEGWNIRYEEYDLFQGLMLPTRLQLEREDTRVRLIVREWRTGP